MPRPLFKFYLLNESGQYYFLNNGVVDTTITPTEITAPISWMQTQIKWQRSMTYMGLIRSLTTPYEFIDDSKIILSILNSTQGIEAFCRLKIKIINHVGGDWTYVDFVDFGLDFSTFYENEITDDNFVLKAKINAIEDGPYKYIRENENTPYEIDFGGDAVTIKIDGVRLQGEYNYVPISSGITIIQNADVAQFIISTVFYSNAGAYDVGNARNQGAFLANPAVFGLGNTLDTLTYDNYKFKASTEMQVAFDT